MLTDCITILVARPRCPASRIARCTQKQERGRAEKRDVFPRVKFSLAFENSEEPDYVTEKFFQSIDYGAIPIVIGAPNIQVASQICIAVSFSTCSW